jgi:hypothetical protein
LLRGWSGHKDVMTGKFVDGPRESWKPDVKVVKASNHFLYQTGRLSHSPNMGSSEVLAKLSGHDCKTMFAMMPGSD